MNRDDYLNSIAKHFARLTHEMRALNAIGRFDINSVAEDFLVPVLKIAYSCPNLRNQNEIQMNFPAVDLGCRTNRISFQVTTDASSGKVQKTLEGFRKHDLDQLFDEVYVIALTEKQASYNAKPLQDTIADLTISFNPELHIIGVEDLLARFKLLETGELLKIDEYLASEWAVRDRLVRFRTQLDDFLRLTTDKIQFEKNSGKYIPSVFVETHSTKEEMRLFAHPLFFYRRIQDRLAKASYAPLNALMVMAREPEITYELNLKLLSEKPATFAELDGWLDRVSAAVSRELDKVRHLSWYPGPGGAYRPVNGDAVAWDIVRIKAESSATGLLSRFEDVLKLVGLIRKKIFLVTSMAGQGKTNFVCDLVENQFRSFELPCLFVPARELNRYSSGQRLLEYISNNRYAPDVQRLHGHLELFNDVALEAGKPFLIVIDGINEVADLSGFSDELRDFCSALGQYDMIKAVITCRSEFFEGRFASLMDDPIADRIHRVADLRSKMSDRSRDRLIRSYFSHFQISANLSRTARDFLKSDLLLLRIFCERYRGHDVGFMADIYKGDLFDDYLAQKIKSFPSEIKNRALFTLYRIVEEMLAAGDFSKLSVRYFTAEQQAVVRKFIEEDIILRQEIGSEGLASIGDLAISFTYNELRDFVIAHKLAEGANSDLETALASLPSLPIYEGVYRYIYLLVRKSRDPAKIVVCEGAQDFIEHYSLNVHLLPPSLQNAHDVDRAKLILADSSAPDRARRVAWFLLSRRDPSDLLNVSVLGTYLNGLGDPEHTSFIKIFFAHRYEWKLPEWRKRLHEMIHDVAEIVANESMNRFDPEWLGFFLHSSAEAGWLEREHVSTMFREGIASSATSANCREAVELARPAASRAVQALIADIKDEAEVVP